VLRGFALFEHQRVSKDAYLIGKDENYRITLASHGETNNKIEKADVVYQLTDNG
jgi:hypothetical protein